jgi:hypothetical protein
VSIAAFSRFVIFSTLCALFLILALPMHLDAQGSQSSPIVPLVTGVGIGVAGTMLVQNLSSMGASTAGAASANAMCHPWVPTACPCGYSGSPPKCVFTKNTYGCTPGVCQNTTSGFPTMGICIAEGVCKAVTTGGNALTDISKLLGTVQQVMGIAGGLNSLLNSGGGGGGGGGGGMMGGIGGCTNYYPVSVPSTDPCAYYVPSTSGSLMVDPLTGVNGANAINELTSSLLGGSSNNLNTNINTNTNTAPASSLINIPANTVPANTAPAASTSNPALTGPSSQLTGDIRLSKDGAVVTVINQDAKTNSTVVGFMGSSESTFQPQGIVAGWCRSRPWSTNFLSKLIAPTFFDNLCKLRGYGVGESPVQAAPAVSLTQTKPSTVKKSVTATSTASSTVAALPPEADIWAVPASVPLGSRTTIFWNSRNAVSCEESSPDGNFSHKSLSGGGATVPLSGPTKFTITCTGADGTKVTNAIMVGMSL